MKDLLNTLVPEVLKTKRSVILWITCIAFALGPIMGGVIMVLLDNPERMAPSGMLRTKAQLMSFTIDWNGYFGILSQVVGVGGILVFGFVASWLFGREYSDGTAKDLLALPTSRSTILNSKFTVYVLWCATLAISNLLLGIIIGNAIGLSGMSSEVFIPNLKTYIVTTFMAIALGTPISFFALYGKGYMAPLGFVVLTLVFSQILGAVGVGHYFPWSLPGLYSGAGGTDASSLNSRSFLLLGAMSVTGFIASHRWWKYADQQ